jgi:hypothetical protein
LPASAFRALLAACLVALAACTDLTARPESLTKGSVAARYHLQDQITGSPVGGRERKLASGSTWQAVGTIAEGDVYRPVGTILTAEAMNVHEAYIVVRDRTWVGFWLPAENGFVEIAKPTAIGLSLEK